MADELYRILIDPGHSSLLGRSGAGPEINEGRYNWDLCSLFLAKIRYSGEPFDCRTSRALAEDVVSLSDRGTESRLGACQTVFSIHVNRSVPEDAGAMLFYWPGDELGKSIAESISGAIPPPLKRRTPLFAATDNLGDQDDWLERPRNVLAPHIPHSHPILLECGNMLNYGDKRALENQAIQSALILALQCGLARLRVEAELLNPE